MSKRGRPKRSSRSRVEQTRAAQRKFREKMAEEGLWPMQAYVHRKVVEVVDADAVKQKQTRGQRVELALRRFYRLRQEEAK